MMWLQRVKMGGIPGELVVNWEQSGIKSVPDQLNCQHRSIPLKIPRAATIAILADVAHHLALLSSDRAELSNQGLLQVKPSFLSF